VLGEAQLDVVGRVGRRAAVVDHEFEAELAVVLCDRLAVGSVQRRRPGYQEHDGQGAVTVVDDVEVLVDGLGCVKTLRSFAGFMNV